MPGRLRACLARSAPVRAADPARGAKPVIRAFEAEAVTIPVADDGPFLDIDTPETYEEVFGSVLE